MIEHSVLQKLEQKAHELRLLTLDTTYHAGSGHVGGAMSVMDIMTLLYYHRMKLQADNPQWEERDKFVLSKGHAAIGYVSVLADMGWIPREDLKTFNLTGSYLGMHLDKNKVRGVEASTGSLGHGLPIALGMALAARQLKKDTQVFCVLGDGELNEGSCWEGFMAVSHFKAANLITIVDRNRCMIDGETEDVMALEPLDEKLRAFGFETHSVDGHSFTELDAAIQAGIDAKEKPVAIIANTIKGAGLTFAAGNYKWHYGAINDELFEQGKASLEAYYHSRISQHTEEA